MTESLFPDLVPLAAPFEVVEPKVSADRRRTLRQKADIERGVHPLTGLALLAPPGQTCGGCSHRSPGGFHAWPKCDLYVTGGPASDCRAWWPACIKWVAP